MSSGPYAEVIGDPIDHSLSPDIHGFWLEALGDQGELCRRQALEPSFQHIWPKSAAAQLAQVQCHMIED